MSDTSRFWFRRDPRVPIEGTPWEMLGKAAGPGDPGSPARAKIVERYRGDVYDMALGFSHCKEIAKDLAQDFAVDFLDARIYTDLDQKKGSFRAFVREWVKNRVRAKWQERQRSREVSDEGVDPPWKGKSPEEMVDIRLTITRVNEARKRTKERLKPRAWDALERCFFRQDPNHPKTQLEIADEMDVSVGTLERLLHVARNAFLESLMYLLSKEESTAERMEEEVGIIMDLLETTLARYWSPPLGE